MNRTQFLRLAAVVTLVLGLTLILWPAAVIQFFSNEAPNNVHFVRFLGTALIGFSVLNWMGSRASHAEALPGLYGNLTSLVLATLIDAISLSAGFLNAKSWLILALHAVFAAGFMYYIVQPQREDARQ